MEFRVLLGDFKAMENFASVETSVNPNYGAPRFLKLTDVDENSFENGTLSVNPKA